MNWKEQKLIDLIEYDILGIFNEKLSNLKYITFDNTLDYSDIDPNLSNDIVIANKYNKVHAIERLAPNQQAPRINYFYQEVICECIRMYIPYRHLIEIIRDAILICIRKFIYFPQNNDNYIVFNPQPIQRKNLTTWEPSPPRAIIYNRPSNTKPISNSPIKQCVKLQDKPVKIEKPINKPIEKLIVKSIIKPIEKPIVKSIIKPIEKPINKPIQKLIASEKSKYIPPHHPESSLDKNELLALLDTIPMVKTPKIKSQIITVEPHSPNIKSIMVRSPEPIRSKKSPLLVQESIEPSIVEPIVEPIEPSIVEPIVEPSIVDSIDEPKYIRPKKIIDDSSSDNSSEITHITSVSEQFRKLFFR